MTTARQPDYERMAETFESLRIFGDLMAKAAALRDVWRFGLKAEYTALNKRLSELDENGLLDVINAAHIVHEAAKTMHDEKYGE